MNAEPPPDAHKRIPLKLFSLYLRAYFLRHFTALRLSRACPLPAFGANSILYANHPSWWDPLVLLLFAAGPLAQFRLFAPIDAASLARYPILRRLGLFGVESGNVTATRRFIAECNAILRDDRNLLAVTAQGRFADARERPAGLRNGVAHLLHAAPGRTAVPVALEYVFWNDRLPEALVAFGEPQRARSAESTALTTRRLDEALVATQNALRADAVRRDPARFELIVGGARRDVSGIYGAFRRFIGPPRGPSRRSADESSSPASRP